MPVRIDAGSLPVRDNGILQWGWRADAGFNAGNTTYINHPLNTFCSGEDDALHVLSSERWDPALKRELAYQFSVPNGRYLVALHFAETWPGALAQIFSPPARVYIFIVRVASGERCPATPQRH